MRRMGFLGPAGTHSEAAAMYLNNQLQQPYEVVACANIYTEIQAVEKGELDACLVPVENSIEGSINITLDTLMASDELSIARELIWGVHNSLMVKEPGVKIRKILSHAQPLSQCREYILNNYPEAQLEAVVSTAAAAHQVAVSSVEDGLAAICTRRAGELNKLHCIGDNIEDLANNCTRFYQLVRADRVQELTQDIEQVDKTLLICQIDGKDAGRLCEILLELATRDVNMTRIESRPAKTGLGEYVFFLDVDIPKRQDMFEAALQGIRRKSMWLRNPGKFPVLLAANNRQ